MTNLKERSLEAHKKARGKLAVETKVSMDTKDDLSIYYSPGVAEPCKEIAKNPELSYEYTGRGNTIAVVTDGTAVLGLGDIGPLAAMPVMEGKCALLKKFGNVDAIPICLDTKDTEEIIATVKAMAPSFGGINLEDISAPRCFEIERRLNEELNIPIFHDDQHGTAIVALAGLINALKVVGKTKETVKVIISGAGAAGIAIAKLLLDYGYTDVKLQDSRGLIYEGRAERMNEAKDEIAKRTNLEKMVGGLEEALVGADIFLGVSQPNIVSQDMVRSMADNPIVFAMSNPDPEITVEDALAAGAAVVATGRSDYPNQVNNSLVFPGIFRGALDARAEEITTKMKFAAAEALASMINNPSAEKVIPGPFDEGVMEAVAAEVKKYAN